MSGELRDWGEEVVKQDRWSEEKLGVWRSEKGRERKRRKTFQRRVEGQSRVYFCKIFTENLFIKEGVNKNNMVERLLEVS